MPWAELTDTRCYYEVRGRGDPVLLVTGLAGTCRSWDPITPTLAERFCVVTADARGLGGSRAHRQPTHLSHYAADLVELLDHLQLERVHTVGISWGGVLAQRFASDHASRVDRLALISSPHRLSPYLREMGRLVGHSLRKAPWPVFLRSLEVLGVSPAHLDRDPEHIERRVRFKAGLNVSRAAVARQLRCLMACDAAATKAHIAAETLVIAGEFDALIPHCYGRETARSIAGARFVLLDDAGHNPIVECPQRVLDVLVPFLERPRGGKDGPHDSSQQPRRFAPGHDEPGAGARSIPVVEASIS